MRRSLVNDDVSMLT